MYRKNMEKDNQNIYILNIIHHILEIKIYMQTLNINTYQHMFKVHEVIK